MQIKNVGRKYTLIVVISRWLRCWQIFLDFLLHTFLLLLNFSQQTSIAILIRKTVSPILEVNK